MSFFHSLTASLDDVVFEGRNQAYGAYQLRQNYRRHLASAGAITLGIGALLWLIGLAWPAARPILDASHSLPLTPVDVTTAVIEQPKVAPPTPARARAAAAAPRAAGPAMPTEVAPSNTPQPTAKPQIPDAAAAGAAGPADPSATDGLAAAGAATGSVTGSEIGASSGPAGDPAAPESAAAPFTYVEKMPEFAGGQAALLRYLSKNLRYPARALRDQTEGRVFMSFVVKADGTIADVTILRGLSTELDEEALRVVRQMPAWAPGYQSKRAVAVRFNLPITFKIQ